MNLYGVILLQIIYRKGTERDVLKCLTSRDTYEQVFLKG